MNSLTQKRPTIGLAKVFALWWPLAGSWVLMGLELPAVSAVMARLADPEIHLAAYGGIVFPLSLLIEAPVIMLLAASTALSKNWISYVFLRRFMIWLAGALTLLHMLVAFTPIYDLVVSGLLDAPAEVLEPGRIGLMLMTPWTGSIAIRRFQQGVLIRSGQSRLVGIGTAVRLTTNVTILVVGLMLETVPGIIVATSAVSFGVITEAAFIYFKVQPCLMALRVNQNPLDTSLTWKQLREFYLPLAITPLLTLLALPIGSASLSRMPQALDSLAVWPVLAGLSFTLRSFGLAYQEVVVALLDQPNSAAILRRFAVILATGTGSTLLVVAATPLGQLWFSGLAGLSPELTALGVSALWLAVPLPALTAVESLFQGVLVHNHRTRGLIEAMGIYLLTCTILLVSGTYYGQITGLYVGLVAAVSGFLFQTLWLWNRSRMYFRPHPL